MEKPFVHQPLFAPLVPAALVAGALGYAAALTPSLIPRAGSDQGILAALAFLALYAITAALVGLWRWLGLPRWRPGWLSWGARAIALGIVIYGLANVTGWQKSVHEVAGMEPVESARPFTILGVSLLVIIPGLALGRLARALVVAAANAMARFLPDRVALLGAMVITATLFWTLGNGVLAGALLRSLDRAALQVNTFINPEFSAPVDPMMTGSPASLLTWEDLSAPGRARVASFPNAGQIADIVGLDTPAQDPARVYVGLASAETPEERAALALAELKRINGFERELLVIATPTGRGWIDPSSMSALEYLWRGDVASVSVQYSYLPSWLSLLLEPEYGVETARIVFQKIYDHWRSLPPDARPRLYLKGVSLGARNSELSADVWDILPDPYDGAFWIGPTFTNPLWQDFTARRDAGSPAWRPVVDGGTLVRFATQDGTPDHGDAPWGPVRILYLQYPSDAVTFFEPETFWRPPDWLYPRAPDVAPAFRWLPVVSFLQLLADLTGSFQTPVGVGHAFAAAHYIDSWMELTEPPGWDDAQLERLREWYRMRGM